ncbi:monooxygenase [Streptomyces spiroverticillatus]|uniref:Monooxygenase n=1 Tax=Streptomyces finlayi TaxID=67296 RepID=A0A918WXJ9_9ACTN|nr:flavin reductase family protein [Streptomyces finlayi]GGZ92400.1 monooxygenase [Streptomyces spiroverticillatus]GHC93095.1 monooxygenase [Streptomyces finlayi]
MERLTGQPSADHLVREERPGAAGEFPATLTPSGEPDRPAGTEAAAGTDTPVDPARFRDVLGRFASGITVVAALDEGGDPVGLACQSFASLSLDPPLVLLCVGKNSSSWPKVERARRFGVSILADDQADTCAALGRRGADKFAGVAWERTQNDAVRIKNALATVDCELYAVHEAGDHYVITARVLDLDARPDGSPLLYFRSDYATGVFT